MANTDLFLSTSVPFTTPTFQVLTKSSLCTYLKSINEIYWIAGANIWVNGPKFMDTARDYSKTRNTRYNITVDTAATTLTNNMYALITNFLKYEDFICKLLNTKDYINTIKECYKFIEANEAACTGKTRTMNSILSFPTQLASGLVSALYVLKNAIYHKDYFFSFDCKNITNDIIVWVWVILSRLQYFPVEKFLAISSSVFNRPITTDTYCCNSSDRSTTPGTSYEIKSDNFFKVFNSVVDYVKNKFSDIIIAEFGDLNLPVISDSNVLAFAGNKNGKLTSNNKTLQVNNNQILKICQGENTILDLTN